MISFLKGTIHDKTPRFVTILCNGVGWHAEIPLSTYSGLPGIGEQAELRIVTIMKDDGIRLFGFSDQREEELFRILIGVSKIGPRLALNILSGIPSDQLIDAVLQKDVHRLVSIPGIGKKSAERLILECREKIEALGALSGACDDSFNPYAGKLNSEEEIAVSALESLGFKKAEASRYVKAALMESREGQVSEQELIRSALRKATKTKA